MHEPFAEFAALLLICALTGALFVRLRQPVLIAYIVVGVLVGPAVFGLVTAHDQIALLAQVGVAVLLFAVGLKLDLHHIRHIGPVALATGLGQLSFTIVIGFAIVMALGREWMEALYVAVALTFSSTIIIVKLLSDKRELDSLHGRIAVGFLIVQDLAVVIAMMTMSALRGTGGADGAETALIDVALSLVWRLALAAVNATAGRLKRCCSSPCHCSTRCGGHSTATRWTSPRPGSPGLSRRILAQRRPSDAPDVQPGVPHPRRGRLGAQTCTR